MSRTAVLISTAMAVCGAVPVLAAYRGGKITVLDPPDGFTFLLK